MSQENVELVREVTDAANRVDVDALVAVVAPDVVWEENPELPGLREVYRGRAEVREWAEELIEVFESGHIEVVEITELRDDGVFTENVLTARGKGSGVPVDLRFWSVYWVAEGEIARRRAFWNRDDALEAAGLEE
jgi:ketosteroid isomerase-like protein